MKHCRNFGMLLATLAIPLLMASCAKDFQGDIDDLNNKYTKIDQRVTDLEAHVSKMNTDLSTLSVLATAVEQGFYVTEVKTTANSYELTLSNGRKIVLQNGPDNTMISAPYISMTVINNVHYWTVNGLLITDKDGKPIPASGQTPIVQYNTNLNQWVISVDGGMTFQNLNVYAAIVINDQVLLEVINNYISQHNTTIFSQELLFQVINTYIQDNYTKIFNTTILNKVIANYLDKHYTTIFDYDLLVKLFDQYNFEYAAKNINVDIIANILIDFIQSHSEIFVNNEVLFEIIQNYIELNHTEIFDTDIIAQVINSYIEKNTNFINVDLMKQIINNYIDLHQDIIFDNETFITILQQYVQENYALIFNQNILLQYFNKYITDNKTTIFNKEFILELVNNYVQNNYTTIINTTIIQNVINNYISEHKYTFIDENILLEIVNNYFLTYNIPIDENIVRNIINKYIANIQITDINVNVVEYVVKQYIEKNISVIFDVNILQEIIINYINQSTYIQTLVSNYKGIIEDVNANDEVCYIKLSDGRTITLTVYNNYARIRDRVQSIVVIPNSNGHINYYVSYGSNIQYLVTPVSMSSVIHDKLSKGEMTVEFKRYTSRDGVQPSLVSSVTVASDGTLIVTAPALNKDRDKAIALSVKDNTPGGTDYTTTFTPIDYISLYY